MLIQKCNHCSEKFKWVDIIKSILFGFKPIECSNCKKKHYIAFSSRLLIAISIPVPLLAQKYLYSIFNNYFIFVYFLWVIFIILFSPFVLKYVIKE